MNNSVLLKQLICKINYFPNNIYFDKPDLLINYETKWVRLHSDFLAGINLIKL